jgi:methyl-accepting chemotaxis protein
VFSRSAEVPGYTRQRRATQQQNGLYTMHLSIKSVFALLFAVVVSLIGTMLVIQHFQAKAAAAIDEVGAARYESFGLAEELRLSSDALTRMARTYVVTGDPKWEQQYLEVLDIRNGKRPRPGDSSLYWDLRAADIDSRAAGETVPLQTLFRRAGFTEVELGKLREAQANSDELVLIETIAMNLVKGNYDDGKGTFTKKGAPDLEKARNMMHSPQYHQAKAKIMKPIGEFVRLLDARTSKAVEASVARFTNWAHLALVVQLASMLACAGLLAWAYRASSAVFTSVKDVATTIASGDLSKTLEISGGSESARIMGSLSQMQARLSHLVAEIRTSADSIRVASSEVASGNLDLSVRTEHAASNLQQAASSMEQLTGTVRQTADSADTARRLASSASEVAQRGGEAVTQVVSTMTRINESSRRIADITGVIDGIAFQTNILALNAAVEAARAGEQGRGFAVVASEVRTLAQRSAEAAKQIKGLIGDSVSEIDAGSQLVESAGATMAEIVSSVQRVSDIIGEISAATIEQASGIADISTTVSELDRATQQNAALVEEGAAAAESLKDQARNLNDVVAAFKVAENANP